MQTRMLSTLTLIVVFIVSPNLPVAGQDLDNNIEAEVAVLRALASRLSVRFFNESTGRYEGCGLPEEDKNDIEQLISQLSGGFSLPIPGASIDSSQSPLSNLREVFRSLSSGYYKARSGQYVGCDIPEAAKQEIGQLLDRIESKTQRVVPRVAPSPKPVKPSVPLKTEMRNPKPASGFEIIQKKFENLSELSVWLNGTTKKQRLTAIVPIGENVSAFIFEVLPRVESFSYSFHHVNGPPTESELTQTIEANTGTVFVGVHRYGASQYFAATGGSIIVLRK